MISKKALLFIPLIFLAAGCNQTTTVVGLPTGTVTIDNHPIHVQIAETQADRDQGLSGVAFLASNDGMIFLFANPNTYGFWMKDMNFPLDFIWIRNNQIVEITSNVKPEPGVADSQLTNYFPKEPIDSMIEVNAGWAAHNVVEVGDSVSLTR